MNERKGRFWISVLELIAEFLFFSICFGLGLFILKLFGIDLTASDMNPRLATILGVVLLIVALGITIPLAQWIKDKYREK